MRIVHVDGKASEIDTIVREFLDIVERNGKYAIVSGYISILLGMERPTQDIDVVALLDDPDGFEGMARGAGYDIPLMPGKFKRLYEMGEKIDIFTDTQWYFDFKKPSNKWALESIRNPVMIIKGGMEFLVSPPEIQIPYKLWLGSDKDIKDAAYIYERLKDIVNPKEMEKHAKEMGVDVGLII